MNTTKLYQDGDGFLLTTNEGNYEITNEGIYTSTRTGAGLEEAPFDTVIQAMMENAMVASEDRADYATCKALSILVNEKIEDFD